MTLNRSLSAFCWWLSCWCVWKLWLWCHRHDSRYSVRWLGTSWGLSSWVCSWKVICYRFKWMNLLDRQANTKNTRTVSLDKLHILLLPQPLQCSWGKWGVSGIKPAKISHTTQQINRKFLILWFGMNIENWPLRIAFWHSFLKIYLKPWSLWCIWSFPINKAKANRVKLLVTTSKHCIWYSAFKSCKIPLLLNIIIF